MRSALKTKCASACVRISCLRAFVRGQECLGNRTLSVRSVWATERSHYAATKRTLLLSIDEVVLILQQLGQPCENIPSSTEAASQANRQTISKQVNASVEEEATSPLDGQC